MRLRTSTHLPLAPLQRGRVGPRTRSGGKGMDDWTWLSSVICLATRACSIPCRHREPRSGVAIQGNLGRPGFLRIAASPFGRLAMTDLSAPGLLVTAAREFHYKPLKRLNPRPGLRRRWPSPRARACFETRRVASRLTMRAGRFAPPLSATVARKTGHKPLKGLNLRPGLRRPWRSPRAQPCFETRRVASRLGMRAGRFAPPRRQATGAREFRCKPLKG